MYFRNELKGVYGKWVKAVLEKLGDEGQSALLEWQLVNEDRLFSNDVDPTLDEMKAVMDPLEQDYKNWLRSSPCEESAGRAQTAKTEEDEPQGPP